MKICLTLEAFNQARHQDDDIALVPTMGSLHEGHLALVREARQHAKKVVVSIFVNPLQFSPHEDFDDYPRMLEADCAKLEGLADIVFAPSIKTLYPKPMQTQITNPTLSSLYCGQTRPHFFDGVLTVVGLLFQMLRPQVAIFGQKDAQQCFMIGRMIDDFRFPIQLVSVPTIRESDGLAMSSRNGYLSSKCRARAPYFFQGLKDAVLLLQSGKSFAQVQAQTLAFWEKRGLKPEYLAWVSDSDFLPVSPEAFLNLDDVLASSRLLAAVHVGQTRLIDNVKLTDF